MMYDCSEWPDVRGAWRTHRRGNQGGSNPLQSWQVWLSSLFSTLWLGLTKTYSKGKQGPVLVFLSVPQVSRCICLYFPPLFLQSIIKSVTLAVWVASAGLFSLFSWFWKVYMNATLGWWVRCWERLATCQAFTLSWRCPTTSSGDFLASEPKVGKEERYNLKQ